MLDFRPTRRPPAVLQAQVQQTVSREVFRHAHTVVTSLAFNLPATALTEAHPVHRAKRFAARFRATSRHGLPAGVGRRHERVAGRRLVFAVIVPDDRVARFRRDEDFCTVGERGRHKHGQKRPVVARNRQDPQIDPTVVLHRPDLGLDGLDLARCNLPPPNGDVEQRTVVSPFHHVEMVSGGQNRQATICRGAVRIGPDGFLDFDGDNGGHAARIDSVLQGGVQLDVSEGFGFGLRILVETPTTPGVRRRSPTSGSIGGRGLDLLSHRRTRTKQGQRGRGGEQR